MFFSRTLAIYTFNSRSRITDSKTAFTVDACQMAPVAVATPSLLKGWLTGQISDVRYFDVR